jgi:hypothetical protein
MDTGTGMDFSWSFICFPLLITIPLLLHTHLTLPSKQILGDKFGALSVIWYLADYRVRKLGFKFLVAVLTKLDRCTW